MDLITKWNKVFLIFFSKIISNRFRGVFQAKINQNKGTLYRDDDYIKYNGSINDHFEFHGEGNYENN
jgi:hypothetical protein